MRILLTTFTYPPNADGVAEHASVLAEGLARRGHSITVATEFHPDRKPNDAAANPRVEQFKISGQANWRIGIRGAAEERNAYRKFLREFTGDLAVFSCWDVWSTSLALPVMRKMQVKKKVLVSHGYTAHLWNRFPKFPWGLTYWLGGWPLVMRAPFDLRRFDQLVVLSRRCTWDRFFDHRLARATGFKNVEVIPNGVFADQFNGSLPDFRADFGIGPGPLLLCVANYSDRKNQLMAVRAFRRAQLQDATLVFIGSEFNDYSSEVRRLNEELERNYPVGRVVLLEKVSHEQKCAAYRAADLFVLSAKAETQPIVLLEAMASRLPFITTNVGCVTEFPGGVVVESEQEMAEQINALMASPERRRQLAEKGWAACQKTYDWNQAIAAYERLFIRLTAGRQATDSP